MSEQELIEADGGEALIPGPAPLTPKEELFVRAYADVESETFGRAVASAKVAGYASPRDSAWKLRRRSRIVAAIAELEKLVRVQVGKVLTDLEFTRKAALAAGDWSTATRCSELQGKHLAMWTDKVAVDDTYVHVYDERAAIEARKITRILLLGSVEQGPLLLDAPPVPAAVEAIPVPPPARATPEQIERAQVPPSAARKD